MSQFITWKYQAYKTVTRNVWQSLVCSPRSIAVLPLSRQ